MHLAGNEDQIRGTVSAAREPHFPLKKGKVTVAVWVPCPLSLRSSAWPPPSCLALSHHLCIIVPLPQLTSLYALCTWSLPAALEVVGEYQVLRNFSDENELRPSGLTISSNCVADHRVAHVKLVSRWNVSRIFLRHMMHLPDYTMW
jgi:hypothetical protein